MQVSAGPRAWRPIAVVLVTVLTAASSPLGPVAAEPPDDGLFLSVMPPGQGTSITRDEGLAFLTTGALPAHWTDQLEMYTGLPPAAPTLTDADLGQFFKPAGFGVPPDQVESVEEPAPGVTIVRDSFGVPHITGVTRSATMWGAGYATAADRLFVADVLRHMGRGRSSELLGASPENLAQDEGIYRLAGYSDRELARQLERLRNRGPIGAQVVRDVEDYVEGINAWIAEARAETGRAPFEYTALGIRMRDWKPTDVVGVAILIQAFFALGGGGELRNAAFLGGARAALGPAAGERLWRDMRHMEEPEAPTTAEADFPYMPRDEIDPRAVAVPDPGSIRDLRILKATEGFARHPRAGPTLDPIRALHEAALEAGVDFPESLSNWLAVTADAAEAGRPIGVMGPQTGYFSPEIMMELELRGPDGLHALGMAFPGISMYVLIGRGPRFAWSATSGGSDLADIRVELLCNPRGGRPRPRWYLFRGRCRPMRSRVDRWSAPAVPGTPAAQVRATVLRTTHGPVFARGRVDGMPVALSFQRSTFQRDIDAAFPFLWATGWERGQTDTVEDFVDRFARMTGSFNWLYVDGEDVGYAHSGRYPNRAPGVDPDLPSWGTGQWEWRGFLPRHLHPRAINPQKGWIASWNNKPAPEWRAADGRWDYGTLYRVLALSDRLEAATAAGGVSVAEMVRIMAEAATVDLRAQEVLPDALDVLGPEGLAPDLAPFVALLREWAADGGHRLDADGDGRYEHREAVILMDAWWPRLIGAMFDGRLAGLYDLVPLPFDDRGRVNGRGSAFAGGYYGHVQKALRMAFGEDVRAPYRELRCADGLLPGCRDAVAQSLRDAVAALGPDPGQWDPAAATEQGDRIRFTSFGLIPTPPIPWQNRPTWQLVAQPGP